MSENLLDLVQDLRDKLTAVDDRGYAGRCGVAFTAVDQLENAVRALQLDRAPVEERMLGRAPIEERMPCFRCGRRGSVTAPVVDRFPNRSDMRNHAERFMHACGICPQEPDSLVGDDPASTERLEAVERRLEAVEQRLAGVIENHHLWDGS